MALETVEARVVCFRGRWRWLVLVGLLVPQLARAQGMPSVFQTWLQAMKTAGYGVAAGSATVTSVSFCQTVVDPIFGTCFVSDPTDPYVLPELPVSPAQYVDPYFGQLASETLPDGRVVSSAYRLDPSEAALVIVNVPPLAAYFSYQGYVFTRVTADYTHSVGQISPDPARADIASTYNNSINDVDIAAASGLQWGGQTVAFITTQNAAIAKDMARRFKRVGGGTNLIYVDRMGPNVLPGLGQSADDFMSLLRYINPQNATAAATWLGNVTNNVFVYRIDPPTGLVAKNFGNQPLLTKGYTLDEHTYQADMTELTGLLKTWLGTQETKPTLTVNEARAGEKVSPSGVLLSGNFGDWCIKHAANCNDDEQDGAHFNVSVGTLAAGRLFILAGVNEAVTNNATNLSLSVTDSTTNTGLVGVTQSNPGAAGFDGGTITGSAVTALQDLGLWAQASPQLQQDAPNLFVQIFTLGCTAQQNFCAYPFTTLLPTIGATDRLYIDQRAYVLPGHPNAANPDYLLPAYAVF